MNIADLAFYKQFTLEKMGCGGGWCFGLRRNKKREEQHCWLLAVSTVRLLQRLCVVGMSVARREVTLGKKLSRLYAE